MAIIGRDPENYGFSVEPNDPLETERVPLSDATDLRVIAEAIGVHVDTLKDLNPQVLRLTTPPDDAEFELILPKGYTDKFNEKVASLPESERVLWRHHEVVKGETLSVIAKKYGVTVNDLTQANNLSVQKTIQVGKSILIPMSGAARLSVAANASSSPTTPSPTTAKATTPSSYTVRSGDTLSEIAAKFSVTVNDIKKWNKLTSTRLNIGQKLAIGESKARIAN
jgi:membrane-bound lytic murein transglycosylase D